MDTKIEKQHNNKNIKIVILCIAVSLIIFGIDSFLPLGVAGGVPYILVILLSMWSSETKLPYQLAILVSILTIAGYFISPHGGEMWKVFVNRFLALFAIWVTAILSMKQKKAQEEKANAFAKLKILNGLLPICMSCKKIRSDDGYWGQIEMYIREHSEAEFSHGICPDCAKELYPDFDLSTEQK